MKKILTYIAIISFVLLICGFTGFSTSKDDNEGFVFDINDLYDYQKQFKSEPLTVCSTNDAKTYMDYRMTNLVDSRQYQFLRYECTVDKNTGFLYDKDGFIAVANDKITKIKHTSLPLLTRAPKRRVRREVPSECRREFPWVKEASAPKDRTGKRASRRSRSWEQEGAKKSRRRACAQYGVPSTQQSREAPQS